MTQRPWFQFYSPDWRADPALRVCSIASRGLWMEMLCLMHEADERGSLKVGGTIIDTKRLASLAGITVEEATDCLAELESAGVFSRDDDGTIFSRRMRRDTEKTERLKLQGAKGGNPKLKPPLKPKGKPPHKPHMVSGFGLTETPTLKKEASTREEASDLPEEPEAVAGEFSEVFWPAYPNRVNRLAAEEAFEVARTVAPLDEIMAGVDRYKRNHPPDKKWMNPDTFLTGERWTDEAAADGRAASQVAIPQTWITNEDPRWPSLAERWRAEKGKPPPRTAGVGGMGCYFRSDWLSKEQAAA